MRSHFLLLVYLLAPHLSWGQGEGRENEFVLSDSFKRSTLQGHLHLFSTPDSGFSLREVSEASPPNGSFRLLTQEIPTLGMDNRYHWVRCRLRNAGTTAQELVFGLNFFEVNDLSLYVVDEAGRPVYRWEHLSRNTPFARKPVPVRQYAFPFVLKPGQRFTLYARVYRAQGVLLLPFGLFSKNAFYTSGFSYDVLVYFVLGIFLFLSLATALLFVVTRQRVLLLLHYAGYTVTAGLFFASLEGILKQFIPLRISFLDENANSFLAGIALFFELWFTIEFLRTPTYAPTWLTRGARWFTYFLLIVCAYILVTPFQGSHASVISACNFLGILLIVGLIGQGLGRSHYEALIYLIAIAPFFVGMVWFALTVVFNLERTWLFYKIVYIAPVFEVCVLSVGIGYKLIKERERYFLGLNALQRQFTASLIKSQESERQRIAADLHDDLGGTLATIRHRVADIRQHLQDPAAAQAFEALEPLIRKSGEDLRRIAHNLMPPEFARLGLRSALERLVTALPHQPTRMEFLVSGPVRTLPLDTELNAYRIASELVQNVLKHAQAPRASVQLLYFDTYLSITVEDDGVGNSEKKSVPTEQGIGLVNSNLRAKYIGATLRWEWSQGGTLVILDIPYPTEPNDQTFSQKNSTDRRPPLV